MKTKQQFVTVSPKFQVVIPRDIREAMGLRAGESMQVMLYENRVEFILIRPMRALRGFLSGDSRGNKT